MNATLRIRHANPNAKLTLRDPHTQRTLPAEGGEVPDNVFWRRRLRDGDVVLHADEGPLPAEGGTPTGLEHTTPLTTRTR